MFDDRDLEPGLGRRGLAELYERELERLTELESAVEERAYMVMRSINRIQDLDKYLADGRSKYNAAKLAEDIDALQSDISDLKHPNYIFRGSHMDIQQVIAEIDRELVNHETITEAIRDINVNIDGSYGYGLTNILTQMATKINEMQEVIDIMTPVFEQIRDIKDITKLSVQANATLKRAEESYYEDQL